MKVYIDIYFLENLIVNLFLLTISFKITRYEYRRKKIYISAILGAIYSVLIFFDSFKVIQSFPFKVIISFIMIFIAMKNKKIKSTIKTLCIFFLGSYTLAGICFSMTLVNNTYKIFDDYTISNNSIKGLILATSILYIVLIRISEYLKERGIISNLIYDVEIPIDDSKLVIKAFLDTGNSLREPVTNLPCIIIEEKLFKFIKKDEKECFKISYDTIGDNGNMLGIKSDNVKILMGGKVWRNIEVVLCGCPNKLSEENEFNALLSRGVI